MIQVLIALLVIVVVARLILKGYRAEPVLFIAGLVLMICTALTGWGSVLPKGVAGTGISFLDPFEVMRDLFSTRAADLGLMIMALMGFAHYMDHIGANEAVVRVVTKPLRALRSPYILLFFLVPARQSPAVSYSFSHWTRRTADGNNVPYYAGIRAFRCLCCRGNCHLAGCGVYPNGNRCYQDRKRSIWMWWNTWSTTGTGCSGYRFGRGCLPFFLAALLRS